MTFLFAQSDKRRRKANTSHPDSKIRLKNILATIATNLEEPVDLMPHLLADVFRELHALEERIPALATFERVKTSVRKPGALDELDALESELDVLRKSWEPFAYRQRRAETPA